MRQRCFSAKAGFFLPVQQVFRTLAALSLPLLAACSTDETLTGFAETGSVFTLVEQNGAPFEGSATLVIGSNGSLSGQGPCNSYMAQLQVPYPWFELDGVGATRRACPELDAEAAYFDALTRMTIAEVSGPVLILSNTEGEQLVFESR